uniref:RUN and SH3 domain containing 2 n=1 Tax=Cyprinus carpio TaxID=7962 RepID=A0A8C2IBV6_CYPCA
MDSPPKLARETLIVHHIPLVHCQVSSSRQCCGSPLKRNSNPFSCPENLGLSRTTSLPERDILQREALVYSSLIQTSSSSLSSSDTFGDGGIRGGRNPFLLNTEDEDDEDEDNLNGYLEDSSFHLHGNSHEISNFTVEPFLLHGSTEKQWSSTHGPSGEAEHRDHTIGGTFDLSTHMEGLNLLRLDSHRRYGSSGSTLSMDCGEQEWGEDDDYEDQSMQGGRGSSECSSLAAPHCSCCGLSQPYPEPFHESFSESHQGYGSDSSCNSSDGVLVNFSTIYNKMNNVVPAKQSLNINSSAEQSCASSVSELVGMCGTECNSGRGAFYLDLHTSPIKTPQHPSATQEHANSSSVSQPQGATMELDANCNSYHNLLGSEALSSAETSASELTSCLQSQARLVVATQNYYKLVTCDISSQSSPSPVGSSVTSCSDEHSKGSPIQPTEYYLFQQMKEDEEEEDAEVLYYLLHMVLNVIEGQVYINISPPTTACSSVGASGSSRPRSRSYDRNLDKSPSPRLGSLERMLSCPVRLSESAAPSPPPPPRVTSFAEIARNKRRTGGSPSQRGGMEATSMNSHSSGEFSPILEDLPQGQSHSLPPLTRSHSQGSCDMSSPHRSRSTPLREGGAGKQARTKAEGKGNSTDSSPVVIRYSKDQRPTSLPIQPFTFQHQFGKPQAKPLLPLLDGYISQMQARGATAPEGGEDDLEEERRPPHGTSNAPTTVRPSPLGSYSPVRLQDAPTSSGTCSTCTPTPGGPRPPRSLSCPISAVGTSATGRASEGFTVHHLSPQALKWREYRRKNPLGVERGKNGPHSFSCALETKRPGTRVMRRNVFDFPPTKQPLSFGRLNGQSLRQLPQCYSDFLPDYFSQTERPPEEFCLSPDANTEESISIDLLQKRGLVKAINTAVDLIVAHFGTSRDAGVKAKLGNSSVSPNVGHLILKYLCPAIREILHDGLKAYVLDLIIGQRKNQPWSVVEASTQLGPSTRVLHSLFSKVSQYSELTNHTSFIFLSLFISLFFLSLFLIMLLFILLMKAHFCTFQNVLLEAGVGKECLRKSDPGQIDGGGWCAGRMKGVGEDCEKEKRRERDGAKQRNRQAGWWYQLMQSSQVYIDNSAEGSKFVKLEKRRKGGVESHRKSHPPPREGVVEGAEAIQQMDEQGKPSWMGSPPESVLTELKKSKEKQPDCQDAFEGVQAQPEAGEDGLTQVLRWGRLFGAGNASKVEKSELPSGWLSLDRSMLDLVAQSVGVGKRVEQHSFTEVKALCHHIATEPGQLSFHKGDVLQVLSRADSDWLLCALGDSQGLVPFIYVTLIADSQEH